MKQRTVAYIGLGSNLGDRRAYLYTAVQRLHEHPSNEVLRCSSIYETAPVGLVDQPYFLNMVIAVHTLLTPESLLQLMLDTELGLGRVRDQRWGPRTIDLDMLLYGDASMQTTALELPHPRMRERAFVLIPLVEILDPEDVAGGGALVALRDTVDGKGDVQLWQRTTWRSAYGRFES